MAAKCFQLAGIETEECQTESFHLQAFLTNFQTAMLLSLLDRGLLTQWQFERCVEDLKDKDV